MTDLQKGLLVAALGLVIVGAGFLAADRLQKWRGFDSRGNTEESTMRLREADEYLRQNSRAAAASAAAIFNRVLSWDMDKATNQSARYGLGVALEKMGDRAAAMDHYQVLKREGVQDKDLAEKVDFSLGKLLLYINHEAEGRSLLDGILARTQDNRLKSRVHTAFGTYYLRRRETRRAKEHFAVALKYFPENLQAELGRADALRGMGRSWEAYEYYDDFIVGNANLNRPVRHETQERVTWDAYESGVRAYRADSFDDAVKFFRKAAAESGDSGIQEKSLYWIGESYAALGKNADAIKAFDKVLVNANSSMDQPALIKKGIILFQSGRYSEAAAAFNRAVEHYPTGSYTEKAKEWQKETEAQIRDRSQFEDAIPSSNRNQTPDR